MAHIKAEDVTVEFPIYDGVKSRSLKKRFIHAATGGLVARDVSERVVIRALDKVSFELKDGDRLGLVGHNGSGKSTLLRTIAGAYEPVGGTMQVTGRIASMLSITLGMDPEATGYENIFLRATVMGFKPREIAPLVDQIAEFSDLGEYINMPLRTYSSGMSMRLAFAISTSVDADIVLMDEWLSAGDAAFAEKAHQRLTRMISKAKILVLASHDENLLRNNCSRIMRLEHGRIAHLQNIETNGTGAVATA
ncbi:MAG: ABC transporter ATP-binding protein [Rhodospirillaceae bacterium]